MRRNLSEQQKARIAAAREAANEVDDTPPPMPAEQAMVSGEPVSINTVFNDHARPAKNIADLQQADGVTTRFDATRPMRGVRGGDIEDADVRYFQVQADKRYTDKSGRCQALLRAGKVIDSRNYDPADLQRQGVRLQRVNNPNAPIDESDFAR